MANRYERDVLATSEQPRKRQAAQVAADIGLVIECPHTGWCGAIVGLQKGPAGWAVDLEDRHGRRKMFLLSDPFLLDGEPVALVRPISTSGASQQLTASGSLAVPGRRARVAQASRIWVEGKQDAELVERIWGADLRIEGIVVEELGGADDLLSAVRGFQPDPDQRIGVLLDHLVPDSKEQRIADTVLTEFPEDVLILGHPYIDVWQAVRPATVGIEFWPTIPKGTPWKEGVCSNLGWGSDTGAAWRAILAKVRTYADIESAMLGRVEELIDFVTS
ncbi:MAG: DUF3097 domain-containing protein [Candidatus Nanopelagicales bacterium]